MDKKLSVENYEDNEDDEDPQINETLYTSIMESIVKLWPQFDQEHGKVGQQEFQDIMKKVAIDQQLLNAENGEHQDDQNKLFFTNENLESIFVQIRNQEMEQSQSDQSETIAHGTVVDVLYNVLIQIKSGFQSWNYYLISIK